MSSPARPSPMPVPSASDSSRDATCKRIISASSKHAFLVSSINATAHHTNAFVSSRARASDIANALRVAQDELLRYSMARTRRATTQDKQQQRAAAAPSSVMRRLVGRTGRRRSSASGDGCLANAESASLSADDKQDRAFMQLLQDERRAQARVDVLRKQLDDAEETVAVHAVSAEQHDVLLSQLESLYNSAFDPPESPGNAPLSGFPAEEAAAAVLRKACAPLTRLTADIASETTVLKYLRSSATEIESALQSVRVANRWTRAGDIPFALGAHVVANAGESAALSAVQEKLERAKRLTEEAREVQPLVTAVTFGDIAKALDDGTEMAMFRGVSIEPKVEKSMQSCFRVRRVVDSGIDAAKGRKRELERELKAVRKDVEKKQRDLRAVRAGIFREVLGVEEGGRNWGLLVEWDEEDRGTLDSPLSEETLDSGNSREESEEAANCERIDCQSLDDDNGVGEAEDEVLPQYSVRAGS